MVSTVTAPSDACSFQLPDDASFTTALRTKYPAITYSTYHLEVAPGWSIAYTETGNPNGIPVVFVHGGPGGKFNDCDLCWFDPNKYRIIAFDQRGTGRCTPSAMSSLLHANEYATINIQTFASDMEKLREHLNIDKWLIFGGSWGSALSLYYGQEFPTHTLGLILRGIYLATHEENARFYSEEELTRELGDKWDPKSLQAMYEYAEEQGIAAVRTPQGLLDAFYELVLVRNDFKAMHLWSEFEEYVDSPSPEKLTQMLKLPESTEELGTGLRSHAIFEILFFRNLPNELNLLDPQRLEKINVLPVHIVQGAQDSVCPQKCALQLTEKIRNCGGSVDLHILEGEHHTPHTPAMTDALVGITDAFEIRSIEERL